MGHPICLFHCQSLPQRVRRKNNASLMLPHTRAGAHTHLHKHTHLHAYHLHIHEKEKNVSKTEGKYARMSENIIIEAQLLNDHSSPLGMPAEHAPRKERPMFSCLFCVRTHMLVYV